MKKIRNVLIILLIIIGAFLYAYIGKNDLIYDKTVDNSQYQPTGVVSKIEQSFVCKEDTLDGIRAKCQIIGDVRGEFVDYTLQDAESNKIVASGKASAEEIKNSKFYYFKFDKILSVKDKTYKIIFENTQTDKSKGIGFFYQGTREMGLDLKIDGNDTEGTLIIKSVTERFDTETFVVLLVSVLYVVLFIKFLYKLFR